MIQIHLSGKGEFLVLENISDYLCTDLFHSYSLLNVEFIKNCYYWELLLVIMITLL